MTPQEYLTQSARTDGDTQAENFESTFNENARAIADLLHAGIGVATEAGELLDAIKKHLYYGKPLDVTNIKEEVGDILWYLAKICRDQGLSFEECMEANIAKLKVRYPGSFFTKSEAITRDIPRERGVLEDPGIVPIMDGRRKPLI